MGQTLGIANRRRAYTLTDRGTYLAFQGRIDLPILVEKDGPLLNIYSVLEANPANGPRVNAAAGKAFADFMLSPEAQRAIRTFGVDKYGQALFVPIGGLQDEGPHEGSARLTPGVLDCAGPRSPEPYQCPTGKCVSPLCLASPLPPLGSAGGVEA